MSYRCRDVLSWLRLFCVFMCLALCDELMIMFAIIMICPLVVENGRLSTGVVWDSSENRFKHNRSTAKW